MAQHKSHPLTGTEVGEPIPGTNTLDRHDELIPRGGNGLEKRLWTRWPVAMPQALAGLVKHTDVHGTGMPVDATVKLVLFRVESPEVSSSLLSDSFPLAAYHGGRLGGGLNKYQPPAADCLQRPLRSRFRQQVSASVAMTSNVKS